MNHDIYTKLLKYFIVKNEQLSEYEIFSKRNFFESIVKSVFKSDEFNGDWNVNILLDKDFQQLTMFININGETKMK